LAPTASTEKLLFEVMTPLNFTVRVTTTCWNMIVTIKHPIMAGFENNVKDTLAVPEQIRASRSDPNVLLFYKIQSPERWICAVVKRLNSDGFLITAYPTGAIKEGKQIWLK
jgi:hypothetical protein